MATPLSAARADALRAAPLTYAEVGATRSGAPVGYRWFETSRTVSGPAGFDELAEALLGWQVQTRAGLRVAASAGYATLVITAFSRPASALARLGGPVSGAVQSWITRRYLRSLDS